MILQSMFSLDLYSYLYSCQFLLRTYHSRISSINSFHVMLFFRPLWFSNFLDILMITSLSPVPQCSRFLSCNHKSEGVVGRYNSRIWPFCLSAHNTMTYNKRHTHMKKTVRHKLQRECAPDPRRARDWLRSPDWLCSILLLAPRTMETTLTSIEASAQGPCTLLVLCQMHYWTIFHWTTLIKWKEKCARSGEKIFVPSPLDIAVSPSRKCDTHIVVASSFAHVTCRYFEAFK